MLNFFKRFGTTATKLRHLPIRVRHLNLGCCPKDYNNSVDINTEEDCEATIRRLCKETSSRLLVVNNTWAFGITSEGYPRLLLQSLPDLPTWRDIRRCTADDFELPDEGLKQMYFYMNCLANIERDRIKEREEMTHSMARHAIKNNWCKGADDE